MEILRPGKLPKKPESVLIGTCKNCHCKVKCKHGDGTILPYSRSNPVFNVKCPTPKCGCIIALQEVNEDVNDFFNHLFPDKEIARAKRDMFSDIFPSEKVIINKPIYHDALQDEFRNFFER